MAGPKSPSVCRQFAQEFSSGKERKHENLVSFILDHSSTRKKIDEWIASEEKSHVQNSGKSSARSKEERDRGNEWFKKKHLSKSLNHYNEAIKYAPASGTDGDICVSLAFANRSAVFNELGEGYYDKCLEDADLALKSGYPQNMRWKLLLRKAGVHVKRGSLSKAQECLEAINSSYYSPDDELRVQSKISEIQTQINSFDGQSSLCGEDRENANADLKNVCFDENPDFIDATKSVAIQVSEDLGRHVVALSEVKQGDLLFCEVPCASVLLEEFYSSHCHHCHQPLHDLGGYQYFIPCSRCILVKFCGSRCAEAAENSYHINECRWLNLLHSVGIAHLALRIVLVAGVNMVLEAYHSHSELTNIENVEIFKKGKELQFKYKRVYSLLDHIDDMYEEDLFQYSLTAGLLTTFLVKKTNFLSQVEKEDQVKIGAVLLRHICQLICNAHAVTDILPDDSSESAIVDEYQKRIATAIYPAASMMNHSCDPNIRFHFEEGTMLMVKAARGIGKGEQVYNCYGPHFIRMSWEERRENLLQQYFFTCTCAKCESEATSSKDDFNALKCNKCKGKAKFPSSAQVPSPNLVLSCEQCGNTLDLIATLQALNVICELQNKGDNYSGLGELESSLKAYQECYSLAIQTLHEDNLQYGRICDSLARSYVALGRINDSRQYLEESLKCIASRFGPESLEFERESKKYHELYGEEFNP